MYIPIFIYKTISQVSRSLTGPFPKLPNPDYFLLPCAYISHIGPIRLIRPILTQKGFLKLTKSALVSYLIVSTVLVSTGIIFLFNPFGGGIKQAEAAWFNDNWAYRKAITLTESGATETNTYLTISSYDASDTTKYQSDCGDVRFTDQAGQILAYTVATCGATTTFHVNLPSILSATCSSTIYIYFGNPAVANGFVATDPYSACAGCSVASTATEEKGTAPVAYWKFNEGVDNTCSGGSNDACNSGSAGTNSDGAGSNMASPPTAISGWQTEDQCVSGKCLAFDKTNDVISAGSPAVLDDIATTTGQDLTAEAWIKPISTGEGGSSGGVIIGKATGPTGGNADGTLANGWVLFMTTSNSLVFKSDEATTDLRRVTDTTAGNTVTLNTWNHVVVTWDGSVTAANVHIFINGIEANSYATSQDGSGAVNSDATPSLLIGNDSTGADTFDGRIDEPKIYNYALSAAQVKANYNSRSNPEGLSQQQNNNTQNMPGALSNGLVGYWKLDETSSTAADSSGNGLTLTNNNTVAYAAGKFGNAGSFTAASSMYLSTATTITGVKTVSFWTNNASTTDEYINLTSGAYITSSSGTISATGFTSPTIYVNGVINGTLTASVWNHVVVTSDTAINADQFEVGRGNSAYNNGSLDDVRTYNRALSSSEVAQLYNWAPGPVGYWKLDEGSGTTAADSSGNANNGTWSGTAVWSNGKYGKAAKITTRNTDFIQATKTIVTSYPFTISAWGNTTYTANPQNLIVIGSTTANASYFGVQLRETNGLGRCIGLNQGTSASFILTGTSSLNDGKWHFISCVFTSDTSRSLYVDGKLEGTNSTSVTFNSGQINRFTIGNSSSADGTQNGMSNSSVDDVKIYNYDRTRGQIIEDMNAGHPAPGSPVGTPLGYWKFNEGADNTCSGGTNDACNSGNGGNGIDGAFTNISQSSTSGWTQAGKYGRGINFEGTGGSSNDLINMGSAASVDNLTGHTMSLSAWIYPNSLGEGSAGVIMAKNGNSTSPSAGWLWQLASTSNLTFTVDGSTDLVVTSTGNPITLGAWNYVALSWDGVFTTASSVHMYVNGREVSYGTQTNGATIVSDAANSLLVGNNNSTGLANTFDGTIDEAKVFNQALTPSQILLDMNQASAQNLNALGTNTANQTGSTVSSETQEYCIPGDSTTCTSPVGRWDLEEGTGTTAFDTAGNGNTGTITAGTGGYTIGKPGKAYNFDNAATKIDAASGSTLDDIATTGSQDLTAEGWIYPNTIGGDTNPGVIFGKAAGATPTSGWLFQTVSTAALKFSQSGGTVLVCQTADNAITLNAWNYVAVTWDGSTTATNAKIYVNGVLKTCSTATNGATLTSDAASNFIIGNETGQTATFDGKIDAVRVFQYARTAAQIAWDYNRGAPVAYWKMDECQGTTINDSSGNSNTGTLTIGASGSEDTIGTCTTSSTSWLKGVTGKRNYSMSLDGTDDYIQVSDTANLRFDAATADFSLFAWVKRTTTGTEYIISKEDADDDGWRIMFDSNNKVVCSEDATDVSSTSTISDTNWHLVGCSISRAGNGQVYIDGIADGTATAMGSDAMATTSNIRIGTRSYTSTSYLNGQIDDTRVYNYALTPAQVKTLYNDGAQRFGPVTGSP